MTNRETTPHRDPDGQLRLALTELGRLEREIAELVPRVRDGADRDLLRALRSCQATLLRMAHVRMAQVRAASGAS
jgi:hypothetical protein